MANCNAGEGCAISCAGQCVAYWDHDAGVCHKQCIRGVAEALNIRSGSIINISIGAVRGSNVANLLRGSIPRDLSDVLRTHDEPITLKLMDTTLEGVVAELYEQMGGVLAK